MSGCPIISAEELNMEDFPRDGIQKSGKMYLLVLSYQFNTFNNQFVMLNGTDFTRTECLQPPRAYFDHCVLKSGEPISKDMVVMVDCHRNDFDKFLSWLNLPSPDQNPNSEVYNMKIIVEVTGKFKRYKNKLDFKKGEIRPLFKSDILSGVRVKKDHHLISFLHRLQENCPTSWKYALETKYALHELIDDIGTISSQFGTQFQTQEGYNSRTNFRFINDLPTRNNNAMLSYNDPSRFTSGMQHILNDLKKENSLSLPLENEVASPSSQSENQLQTHVLMEERHPLHAKENESHLILHETQLVNKISQLPPSSPEFKSPPRIVPGSLEMQYKEAIVCGYSPTLYEPLLVKNAVTGDYNLIDSFELYLRLSEEDDELYTLRFKSPEDIFRLIIALEPGKQILEFSPKHEESIRDLYKARFSSPSTVKLPLDVYHKFLKGEYDVLAPSHAESAPDYFLYASE